MQKNKISHKTHDLLRSILAEAKRRDLNDRTADTSYNYDNPVTVNCGPVINISSVGVINFHQEK